MQKEEVQMNFNKDIIEVRDEKGIMYFCLKCGCQIKYKTRRKNGRKKE